jgi:hypothetical protein
MEMRPVTKHYWDGAGFLALVKIKKKAHLRSYEENARCTSLDEV